MSVATMSVSKLIELFPSHGEEIRELSRTLACGCSICVWNALRLNYPELELPDLNRPCMYVVWG